MTTFQAVIYALAHAVGEFFPIGTQAHTLLLSHLTGWQAPMDALWLALEMGSLLALVGYFRHDIASMVSSLLQVILFRKRPMTLDERLPIFLTFTSIPIAFTAPYFQIRLQEVQFSPLAVALLLAVLSLPLWFFDQYGRKNKNIFDMNLMDAGIIGLTQAAAVIPGWDHLTGALFGALFLNYKREPAAKYAFFATVPILIGRVMSHSKEFSFRAIAPAADLTWLSFGTAFVVSLIVSVLVLGGLMKQVTEKSLTQYIVYRWILAIAVGIAHFWKG